MKSLPPSTQHFHIANQFPFFFFPFSTADDVSSQDEDKEKKVVFQNYFRD